MNDEWHVLQFLMYKLQIIYLIFLFRGSKKRFEQKQILFQEL